MIIKEIKGIDDVKVIYFAIGRHLRLKGNNEKFRQVTFIFINIGQETF